MTKLIIHVLLLAVFSWSGLSQTDDSQSAAGPEERHQEYVQLNRQIYARHGDPESGKLNGADDKVKSTSQQLRGMISREIETALSASKPSDAGITAAISKLQGDDLSMAGWAPDMNIPFGKLFTLDGIQTLAVGYVILQGGDAIPDTQAYLEFYDKSSGVWKKKASAPTRSDFERLTFSLAQLKSGVPGEAWFLAWGTIIGSSHGSKNVYLYAFDGSTVRTIWQRKQLPGGTVTAAADSVTLEYEDNQAPDGRAQEVLHVTASGLQ